MFKMISILTILFSPLLEVSCTLVANSQKAIVYFSLATISGFLLSTTCICGAWIALKLAPITDETPKGRGVQTDEVGGVRLSGMTPSLVSTQNYRRNNGTSRENETHDHRYKNIISLKLPFELLWICLILYNCIITTGYRLEAVITIRLLWRPTMAQIVRFYLPWWKTSEWVQWRPLRQIRH